jgi:hypothetical protein
MVEIEQVEDDHQQAAGQAAAPASKPRGVSAAEAVARARKDRPLVQPFLILTDHRPRRRSTAVRTINSPVASLR